MCGAVCTKNAITIQIDTEGFYRPVISEDLCVDCGACVNVCAKFDNNVTITTDDELLSMSLYAASTKDDEVIMRTTSGGVADLLAKELIAEGYKVVGVVYNNENDKAEHRIASSESETNAFRGSKYIQSYSKDAFRQLVKTCRDEKYAIFGLPCQIYAISRYLERRKLRNQCVLIDLYCHGCPSMLVWEKACQSIKQRMGINLLSYVNWRSKFRGWGDFLLEVYSDGNKVYRSRPMRNEFFDLFFSNQVLNDACTSCKFRGTLAYTDIRLGDFWGPDFRSNIRGVSAVSVVTEEGKRLFSRIKEGLNYEEKSYSSFLPYQSWSHTYIIDTKMREQLFSLLKNQSKSIEDCISPLKAKQHISQNCKTMVKQMVSYLPFPIMRIVYNLIRR